MMKQIKNTMLGWLLGMAACAPAYTAFDAHLPGLEPQPFAEWLISPNGEHVGYCAFSPDGRELYYAVTNAFWSESHIIRVHADHLSQKDTLHLKDGRYEGEPFLSRDGHTLYFMAVLPPDSGAQWHADLYCARRQASGWGNVELLDSTINSLASEWHLSMTHDGVAYFTSERERGTSALFGDIYSARLVNDQWEDLTKLPAPINTPHNDSDPLIAPDESFLIFHSDRPGGFGAHDLYVSFREKGRWLAPVNMGPAVNTAGWEMAPTLTPDGKYLLFTRREAIETTRPAQIFWVSMELLNPLKAKAAGK